MTLERFLAELGSKKGAPGGGAAAALTGALGAALVEMVARLNDGRAGRSSGTASAASVHRKKMQVMIRQDARAFARIQKAYRARKKNRARWQRALKAGVAPPLRVCELASETALLSREEFDRTSDWLKSDLIEARILLRAAFQGARLNVEVNLKDISEASFVARHQKKLDQWQRRF